jgi:hypothetical protein
MMFLSNLILVPIILLWPGMLVDYDFGKDDIHKPLQACMELITTKLKN